MPGNEPATADVMWPGALALPSTYVVIAACAATPGDTPHLETERAILHSAKALERVLLERCGLDERRLTSTVDPDRDVLLSAIRTAAERGKAANGLTLVYYIGHGLLAGDGRFYLGTAGRYTHAAPEAGATSFADVSRILERDGPTSTVVFLDCCQSDRARKSFGSVRPDVFSSDMPRGRYLLASTGEARKSYVREDGDGTSFTSELLRLLTLGDPTRPSMLTVGDCYEHLARELPRHQVQVPHQYSSDDAARIPLAKNPSPAPVTPEGIEPPDPAVQCPYLGLFSFDESSARFFFGRDQAVQELIRSLRRRIDGGGPLAVIGPSGVGKSSLLQAGLMPALTRQALDSRRTWRYLQLDSPGPHPMSSLADTLSRTVDLAPGEIRRRLAGDPDALWAEVARADRSDDRGSILLIVDQFEEIFTQTTDRGERQAFVRALHDASGNTGRCMVVLSIRADFFGHCTTIPDLVDVLQDDPLLVAAMSERELRQAISGPAEIVGLHVGPEVVDRMIADLRAGNIPAADAIPDVIGEDAGYDSAGTLPLLSHALEQAFVRREGRRLTLRSYERTGGIWRAVASTADRVYDELAGLPDGQAVARLMLLSMVHLGHGADDARRSVSLQDLFHDGGYAAELVRAVAERLAKKRLITLGTGTATLTHEAILRCWPRLRRWIEEDRTGLLAHQQLVDATRAWLGDARNVALLYRGSRLDDALAWAGTTHHQPRLKPELVAFLEASVAQRQLEERARRRARRFRRAFTATVTILAIGAASFAYYVYRERTIAISQEAAANAQLLRGSDAASAMALALAAYGVDANAETRGSLLGSYATPIPAVVDQPGQVLDAVAVSPVADLMASGLQQNIGTPQETDPPAVHLWSLADHQHPKLLPVRMDGPDKLVRDVRFSPSGRSLAAAVSHGPVWVWNLPPDLPTQIIGQQLDGPTDGFDDVSISPNDRYVAAIHIDDGIPWIWDLTGSGGHPIPGPSGGADDFDHLTFGPGAQLFGVRPDGVWSWGTPTDPEARPQLFLPAVGTDGDTTAVAFSHSERTIATGAKSGVVRQWDLADPRQPAPHGEALIGEVNEVHHLVYSADDARLASAGDEAAIWIWDTRTGRKVHRLPQASVVDDLAFAPKSDYLVSLDSRGRGLVWDLPGPLISGRVGTFVPAAFTPDGSVLAAGTIEGEVTLWRIQDSHHFRLLSTFTHDRGVTALAFSEDGMTLAVAGGGWVIQLWDVSRPAAPRKIGSPIAGPQHIIASVAFVPGHNILLAGALDGGAYLWSVAHLAKPDLLTTIKPTGDKRYFEVKRVATDPTGRILAIGAVDGIHLWNIDDPRHPRIVSELLPGSAWASGTPFSFSQMAFSPDGKLIAAGGGTDKSGATVKLWDVHQPTDPKLVASLHGPDEPVNSVAFSRDSRTLAAGGYDRNVWLWDVNNLKSPETIGRLTYHTDTINTVAFGGDSLLVSVSSDNTAMLWDTNVNHVRQQICQIEGIDRALDPQAWQRYLPERSQPLCKR